MPLPSYDEQKRIADYLDSKCAKIDAIIEKQQAVIEKLKAYKLSVITEAVTKGLNPDVETKDSGIPFVGNIVKNASITRAGHLYNIILGKMLSPTPSNETDTLEQYFCAANVHFDGIGIADMKKMWFSENEKENYHVKIGDLLVVEGGAGAGGASVVTELDADCYVQNSIMIVRPKKDLIKVEWLYYTLYSLVNRKYIDFVCNKATIPHFTKDKLSNVPIVLMPEETTDKIIEYLNELCARVDVQIQKKQVIIEKLQSYKKSIIYEVVTGKKEV